MSRTRRNYGERNKHSRATINFLISRYGIEELDDPWYRSKWVSNRDGVWHKDLGLPRVKYPKGYNSWHECSRCQNIKALTARANRRTFKHNIWKMVSDELADHSFC